MGTLSHSGSRGEKRESGMWGKEEELEQFLHSRSTVENHWSKVTRATIIGFVSVEDVFSASFSPALSTVKASLLSPFNDTHMHNSLAYLFKSNLELFSPEAHLFSHEQLGKECMFNEKTFEDP
ncbi:hypothetical protein STEG23_037071, partial [Scotinomys teguina]